MGSRYGRAKFASGDGVFGVNVKAAHVCTRQETP